MRKIMDGPRILLVRTGGLGDTVLLWPALCAIRRLHPAAWVVLLGHRPRCELLLFPPGADEVWDIEGSDLHLLYQPEAEIPEPLAERLSGFDTILVFTDLAEGFLLENLSRTGAGQVHMFAPFPTATNPQHQADYLAECIQEANLGEGGPWPPLAAGPEELRLGEELLSPLDPSARAVLLAPGSGSRQKNWPAPHWAGLAGRLEENGFRPLLLRGPADTEAVAEVRSFSGRLPVLDCPTPAALKGALARCALVVGNDSGPVHLAALMGVAALAVFGPSDPGRWAPRGPRAGWVQPQRVDCAPCDDQRRKQCQDRRCLRQMTVDQVWEAARRLVEHLPGGGTDR